MSEPQVIVVSEAKNKQLPKKCLERAAMKMESVIYALFQNPNTQPFGAAVSGFEVRTDLQHPNGALVCYGDKHTRAQMLFDPLFMERHSVAQIVSALLHESLHVVLRHEVRLKHVPKKDQWLARVAKEIECNCVLEEISKLPTSGNCVQILMPAEISDGLTYNSTYTGKTAEEIFQDLKKRAKSQKAEHKSKIRIPGLGEFDVTSVSVEMDGGKTIHRQFVEFTPEKKGTQGDGDGEAGRDQGEGGDEGSPIDPVLKQAAETARNMVCTAAGVGSTSISRILGIVAVKVDWAKVLADVVLMSVTDCSETTWARRPMSSFALGNFLSPGEEHDERAKAVFVAFDQSGSIDDEIAAKFASVIIQADSYFEKLVVCKHTDSNFDGGMLVTEYDTPIDDDARKRIVHRDLNGGTSHSGVFNLMREMTEKGLEVSCAIFLTDMWSDLAHCKFPDGYPLVWVVPLQHDEHLPNVPGKKIVIE